MVVRIRPVDPDAVAADVQQAFDDAARRGAPNPTLLRILARHPQALNAFYDGWQATFYGGRVEHTLKELMRVRMARLRNCSY
jgi:alkylhydroperoxidase family enzyme